MKKILALILILSGFVFLIVKTLSWKFDLILSLMLNILGFIPIALGFALLKSEMNKSKSQKQNNENCKEYPEKVMMKDIPSTKDHSKYMPK